MPRHEASSDRSSPFPTDRSDTSSVMPGTIGGLAVDLIRRAGAAGADGLIHIARSDRRAAQIGHVISQLAPKLDVVVLPPWDCLPYDRASPSREVMGRRTVALRRLSESDGKPRLVITTIDAVMQRVPPRTTWREANLTLRVGDVVDPGLLGARLEGIGYALDERVDEVGEAAIRGQVIDLFPAGGSAPFRIAHGENRIEEIRRYDAVSQRSLEDVDVIEIDPASELVLPMSQEADGAAGRRQGLEHWLPEFYPTLETVFDYLPQAAIVLEPGTEERQSAVLEQVADIYEGRRVLAVEREDHRQPLPPDRLYLVQDAWSNALAGRSVVRLEAGDGAADRVPRFAAMTRAGAAFADFVGERMSEGYRVILAAGTERQSRDLARRVEGTVEHQPIAAEDWEAAVELPPGALASLRADLDGGFIDEASKTAVIAAADLLGNRARQIATGERVPLPLADLDLRLGDTVIHMDHGVGVLAGLESVEVGEDTNADMVRLTFAGDATLMVPTDELDLIWRYGSEADAVPLDRLDSDAWSKRRRAVEEELKVSAERLVALARERADIAAPKLAPPRSAYERFVSRFPFTETIDQALAIEDSLRDLASGRPMDRLVCGDVGFGKTEVALRAAAAAALAGWQVAVVAPTTVLVRQHLKTFERRFAELGVTVGHLSRLVAPAEAKRVKAGLADGSIRIVIGTHAVAAKGVRFAKLGLVVIDEEQRFGIAHKARLRGLAREAHVLTLTATPIPRTLQAALVGLQDLSIIATPPAQRRPIRTFVTPFDPVSIREALLREERRGGQSFVVCPRISDIEPMRARLQELVPDLSLFVAHGDMPAADIDEAMVRFADGEGDVLLATNIIESGLDVPRANTMLVWRADRFGLSQLHQLRGRVGRGRAQGIAYLLTDPASEIPEATRKRLSTLEALDRLGAGFAISARDLDLRGAGDLFGEDQAGHMKLIGAGLYQHLLARAVRVAHGETLDEAWRPEINLGERGPIPADYVPEPEVRLSLYAKLAHVEDEATLESLAEEIEDRFGPLPAPVADLLVAARLRVLCRQAGIVRIDAGPKAIALTPRSAPLREAALREVSQVAGLPVEQKGERLICQRAAETAEERARLVTRLLEALPR